MTNQLNDFAVFILTNGRPDRVVTYDTLKKRGYTGPVYLLVDNLDKTQDRYFENFPGQVFVFDKKEVAQTFDQGDNFNDMRAIIYARNAAFDIAEKLGIKYFMQLDDDYVAFEYRFDENLEYGAVAMRNLDAVLAALLRFYKSTPIDSLAIAQGGDFIGGSENSLAEFVTMKRKCMNSFICSTDRRFQFVGRINEDVNAYTSLASRGLLMFTVNHVNLVQLQTQTNSGGMTEMYLDSGTYVKSFYTVMYQPSSVKIRMLSSKNARLHHSVSWKETTPMILSEKYKK
jgi:hypothetical protein